MISLNAYRLVEDAWASGVADWCRAATPFVLRGGRAWFVTASEGQANWIKQRLLSDNVSLFGVQFLEARNLRRELYLRADLPPPTFGRETLQFLVRLRAMTAATPGSPWSSVARHPEACLAALDDFASAGWLDEIGLIDEILPSAIGEWLPELRATASWVPAIDRRLADIFTATPTAPDRLSLCVFGWDASCWHRFDLLSAAVRAADAAYLYLPLPRGTSEELQQSWLEACEGKFGVERSDCADSGFISTQAALVDRLDGADLEDASAKLPAPELLTGVDIQTTTTLVRDYVARWLSKPSCNDGSTAGSSDERLAILCPCRHPSGVALVRALGDAGIAVEDELGEVPQPAMTVQIQQALLDYHLDGGSLEAFLALIELFNEHAANPDNGRPWALRDIFPLDPVEVRRALHGAFAEVQHHSARVLSEAVASARTPHVPALRRLVEHLGEWPEFLPWHEALARWQESLDGLGLSTEVLEPLWSRLPALSVPETVPSSAFFHYLGAILGPMPARRDPGASHRFARVVVTTLEGAAGQTWGGAVLLDSNEGIWPLYPPENPFLGDGSRKFLNARRAEINADGPRASRGYLLTAADRAQLEHFRFLEVLQNCRGPVAFAAASCDPTDPNKEFYPNEWILRCLVECDVAAGSGGTLLDRWRRTIRETPPLRLPLGKAEGVHFREVWTRRRDPGVPFDEYFFNFIALTEPDELPWAEAWSAGELESAWNRPATFAMGKIFAAEPSHDEDRLTRRESWLVGRLVHRWLHLALRATREPRRLQGEDWARALTHGLPQARSEAETSLRVRLASANPLSPDNAPSTELPLWWQGALDKATWATRRCLVTLAEMATRQPETPVWLCMNEPFRAELRTNAGPLRLRAQCDVVLLDRPGFDGAVCRLIDIRTGTASAVFPPSAALLEQGRGLNTVATLLLALANGVEPAGSRAGIVHPETSSLALSAAGATALGQSLLEHLARQQRTLVFGQKDVPVNSHDPGRTEYLPLATTSVDSPTLAAKARITAI